MLGHVGLAAYLSDAVGDRHISERNDAILGPVKHRVDGLAPVTLPLSVEQLARKVERCLVVADVIDERFGVDIFARRMRRDDGGKDLGGREVLVVARLELRQYHVAKLTVTHEQFEKLLL